ATSSRPGMTKLKNCSSGLLRRSAPRNDGAYDDARSFRPDVGGLDDRPPALGLRLLQRAQRIRRLLVNRRNLNAKLVEPLPNLRIEQHLRHRRVELGDDVLWGALRHPEPIPERGGEAGQSRFIRGGDFWRGREPRLARDRKRLDAAAAE